MRRVAIVDDSPDVRALWRAELEHSGEFVVCAEGDDGHEAIEIAAGHHPDVMLLDLSMPGLGGMQALPTVREASPDTQVVVLSAMGRHQYSHAALSLGACAFLEKHLPAGSLAQRLQEALGDPAAVDAAQPEGPLVITIEPDYNDRCLLHYLLQWRGFRVLAANSGEQALSAMAAERPVAVLVARPLPDMSVAQFADRLAHGHATPVPTIAMASAAAPGPDSEFLGDRLLRKPICAESLHAALVECTAEQGAGQGDELLDEEFLFELRDRLGAEQLWEVLTAFRTRTRERLVQMGCATDAGDHRAVTLLAHELKGAARSLAAPMLAGAAHAVERSIAEEDPAQLPARVRELYVLFEHTDRALAALAAPETAQGRQTVPAQVRRRARSRHEVPSPPLHAHPHRAVKLPVAGEGSSTVRAAALDDRGPRPPIAATRHARGTHRASTEVDEGREVGESRGRARRLAVALGVGLLLWYLAYALTVAYARDLMARDVPGNLSVGMVTGLLPLACIAAIAFFGATRTPEPRGSSERTRDAE